MRKPLPEAARAAAMAVMLSALSACGGGADTQAATNNSAATPEPFPPPQDLAADAELANRAAEAEALDAEIGGNNSGAEANLQ